MSRDNINNKFLNPTENSILSQQDSIRYHLKQMGDFFIIAGCNEGQIIYFDEKENGERKKVVQVSIIIKY